MLNVETKHMHADDEIELAIVSAATLRVVRKERPTPRRSSFSGATLGKVTEDETLDMIKLVIVGDSGVGKTW